MSWTDDRVELLKKLWAEGLSASQIAQHLGGVTRNAVIGKVHRLNLSGRAKPASAAPRQRKARSATTSRSPRSFVAGNTALKVHASPAPRRAPAPAPIEDLVVPISLNVSLLSLTDQMCKWPIGDPGTEGFHFCGHRNFNDLPYCEYHARLAYQPATERRRDRRERDED
ncbi:GcrA family cell cycle regulator [Bauldia sp.]|uniref:GcrA family cell cycle regulator n=1 Tax=Bauldia sp. TaxID=2575872 RepID=UPI003BABC44F